MVEKKVKDSFPTEIPKRTIEEILEQILYELRLFNTLKFDLDRDP